MNFHSLRSRMAVFFALLLAAVLVVVFLLVSTASYQIARQQNSDELGVGERIFRRLLDQNQRQLTQAAGVLAADFGFREAVTSNDLQTVLSALNNHGRRIHADVMMLVSLEGRLVADTLHPEREGRAAHLGSLIEEAESTGSATGIMRLGRDAYQVVVVPVLAPQPVAWVTLGFIIDDRFARDLQALTSLHVSFLARDPGNHWETLASTQMPDLQRELERTLEQHDPTGRITSAPLVVGGFASLVSPLDANGRSKIVAVLQRSIEEAVARFDPLRTTLLVLAIISLIAAIAGSVIIARRITRPINALADVARHIQEGDYERNAEVMTNDEIGALASSFNHMRDAIAFRESEIRRLAYEDGLTGLPNRAMFNDELDRVARIARRTGSAFSILVMNLDRFKTINDTLGHEAGDEVLKFVSARLRTVVRDSDTVARLGGDEFAILLSTGHPDRFNVVVRRIQQTLNDPVVVSGQAVDITCSIGISEYPDHGTDPGTLLRHADVAMYTAKRARSGFAVYDAHYDENRQGHLHLLGELRQAVDQNELCLEFQPKVDLITNQVAGVESLVRWRHPERGFIPPNEFIPFAEHTGAIRMVTRWVIRNAVQQAGTWLSRGLAIKVSINISARDLLDRELPDLVAEELTGKKIPAGMICFEITESALMEDPVNAHATVRRLHEMGVELAIDDYGTGYSSLAYVKNLPVDELKIDRVFVMNMQAQREDIAIVRSTVELGHNLGLRVVAEGVENDGEIELLREICCDQIQGYGIARPQSADKLEAWLDQGPWRLAAKMSGDGVPLFNA